MKDAVFFVGGGKGGVGKSLVSTALVQFFIDSFGSNKTIHLIECDESNPDCGRIYNGKIPVTPIILGTEQNGWLTLFDVLDKSQNTLFVINSAARHNKAIEANGETFTRALQEEGRYNWITFWPVNRQLDSVNLLFDYLRVVKFGNTFVIRNLYFGNPQDFTIFDNAVNKPSQKNSEYIERITGTLDFPALNDLVTLQLYSAARTLPEAAEGLNTFKRQIFTTWRNKAYEMFESTGLFDEIVLK